MVREALRHRIGRGDRTLFAAAFFVCLDNDAGRDRRGTDEDLRMAVRGDGVLCGLRDMRGENRSTRRHDSVLRSGALSDSAAAWLSDRRNNVIQQRTCYAAAGRGRRFGGVPAAGEERLQRTRETYTPYAQVNIKNRTSEGEGREEKRGLYRARILRFAQTPK